MYVSLVVAAVTASADLSHALAIDDQNMEISEPGNSTGTSSSS